MKKKARGSEKGGLSAAGAEQYAKMGVTPGRHAAQASGGKPPPTKTGSKGKAWGGGHVGPKKR